MPIDIILDVNIPKKVKRLNHGRKILHIGDIDTEMSDEDILHLTNRLDCLLVTHDRELALTAAKKHKVLFIRDSLDGDEISACLNKNLELLKTASVLCENERRCKNCTS